MGLFKSLGKIVRGVTKPVKKVLKSDVGKLAALGLGAYYGPKFLGAKSGAGFSNWKDVPWSSISPWKIGAGVAGLSALGSGMEEEEETVVEDTSGHDAYLRYRKYFPFGDQEPIFRSAKGGRVKANLGLYAGPQGGMNRGMNPMMNRGMNPMMGQGVGSMNPLGVGPSQSMLKSEQPMVDPRTAQMRRVDQPMTAAKPPKQSEDTELIQLIKMLTAMGIPMEQLRGRTKDELVEMLVAVSGKGGKEEIIEGEEVIKANTGGLMRTGYAIGSSQFGMGTEHPIIPDKDGPQLDMRDTGGYQPHGKKEKHDDVRALLAQGEFVMTSDAVKGMGGGDRELGAKKMYELMHTMEAMA